MEFLQLIEQLSNARGASGFEDEVIAVAREYCKDFATFKEDCMRNLYVYPKYNKGNRPLVMIDGHADEVGFMVQAIKPDGTLRIIPIGTWNKQALSSSKVQVYTENGYIPGVIAAIPPHFQSEAERNAPVTYESIYIDVGSTCAEETRKLGVKIGSVVVPLTDFEYDAARGLMYGKAFDDRLGVAITLETLKRLQGEKLEVDLVGVISAQEEVGSRGITAVMHNIKPDAAICFEGCPADDTFTPEYLVQDRLHGGVMMRHMDSTVICTPRFVSFSQKTAEKYNVKMQMAVRAGGGNNGAYIVSANGGTPVIVAGVPVRYIHTFHCIAAMDDVEANVQLGVALCKELNEKVIKSF
ncbi:MAG: M20/M25/M40 family metallo-hydrolase [Clostridiales bacterium]|nr:M20/M25/M40 family metallo-hydrolase [Clostridiales bacterium]